MRALPAVCLLLACVASAQRHRTPPRVRLNATLARSRKPVNDDADFYPQVRPEPLRDEHRAFMTRRHIAIMENFAAEGANEWEQLQKVADLYYPQHVNRRNRSKDALQRYCIENLRKILPESEVEALRSMADEGVTYDHWNTEFANAVANLENEDERDLIEQYGLFCKKVYRIIPTSPAGMMSWLNDAQKAELQQLIEMEVTEDQIYDELFHFFNESDLATQEEARVYIDSSCRAFIDNHFGDEIVEVLEDMIDAATPPQIAAARLLAHIAETEKEKEGVSSLIDGRALWLCERIYLNYDGICGCNERSTECTRLHACVGCAANTDGAMCQMCADGFSWRPDNSGCSITCSCNDHAETCDDHGVCQNCTHNTRGPKCEECLEGFIAVPTLEREDYCRPCECGESELCRLSSVDGLPECVDPFESAAGGNETVSIEYDEPSANLTETVLAEIRGG